MINLSASLIAVILTQTALLSFTNKEADSLKISKANGVIGMYMVYRVKKMKKQDVLLLED